MEFFSVYQFFPNDHYERVLFHVPLDDAIRVAMQLATSVGAKIGTTRRVIITDGGDSCVWEWVYGKGLVFPPVDAADMPASMQARGPHEFDCTECGRHVVEFAGPPSDPARCAACVCVPGWYHSEFVASAIDRARQSGDRKQ